MAWAPVVALAVGGPVAVAVAWSLVRARRASVWAAMGATMAALGVLALTTRIVRLSAGIEVWLAYLVANAFSGSIPILLGAAVSGAVWTALGLSSGGVLAPIACHVVWTGLMVAFPPIPSSR